MPIYEYQCQNCGHHLEVLQKISDPPLKKCPDCGRQRLKKLVSAVRFRLAGSGWYETDFKSDQEQKRNLAESGEAAEAKAGPKSDAKADTKADAKDTAKSESKPDAKAETKPETKVSRTSVSASAPAKPPKTVKPLRKPSSPPKRAGKKR